MHKIYAVVFTLILQACAQTPDLAKPLYLKTERLPAQTLAAGECGLFVWTADQERRFILFSQMQTQTGLWLQDGQRTALTITRTAGKSAQEQFSETAYSALPDTSLSLKLGRVQSIVDGTRFQSGTLTVKRAQEWERVSPVVGLAACQPA